MVEPTPTHPHTPPPKDDPFAILGLPRTLALTSEQIQRAYLLRMASAHPDAQSDASTNTGLDDNDAASLAAARLNDARQTLAHPERRAIALYTLLTRDAAHTQPDPKADAALPPGFLMEIMSTREEIESAVAAADRPQIERWRAWAMAQRADYLAAVGALLDARNFPAAKQQLNAWRYIERLIEQLDPAYDPNRADFAG
jgi:DnaJ-domain-containing protein 1